MKPRKPGRNIREAERHTVRVPLRLPPEVAAILRREAEAQGIPVSGLITELVLRTEPLASSVPPPHQLPDPPPSGTKR